MTSDLVVARLPLEERQLQSAATLTTALGVMAVAAWRLLALQTLT